MAKFVDYNPCDAEWDAMPLSQNGRFCDSCQKEVIDFTKMSTEDIAAFLEKQPTACGRYKSSQLKPKIWISILWMGLCVPSLGFPQQETLSISTPVYLIKGQIKDRVKKSPVSFAQVILYEYLEDSSLVELRTLHTDKTGEYSFVLDPNKKYKILGAAEGYMPNEASISTMEKLEEQHMDTVSLRREILIEEEIIMGMRPITLDPIYFTEGSFYLSKEAKRELDVIGNLMFNNSGITLRIYGYVNGSESQEGILELGDKRAKAAIKYLVELGVEPERLSGQYRKETSNIPGNPSIPNLGCKITFHITGFDYKK